MKRSISILIGMVAMLTSCMTDDVDGRGADTGDAAVAAKFVNSSADAAAGSLLLYVDDATAERWSEMESVTRSGNASFDALAMEMGVTSIEQVFNMKMNSEEKRERGLHRWFSVSFDENFDLESVAKKYALMPEVSRVQYCTKLARPKKFATPISDELLAQTRADDMPYDDPMLPLQWHYDNTGNTEIFSTAKEGEDINAFGAWKYATGNPEIIVAVVDEGVYYDHEDLKANMWTNEAELNGAPGVDDDDNGFIDDIYGINAYKKNGDITWDHENDVGHGTHIAGTIAAVNNNGIGVSGIAGGTGNGDGVRIMSCQIFCEVDTTLADNARAIDYAADNGASIIQCSWGYPNKGMTDSDYERIYGVELEAIQYFVSKRNCSVMNGGLAIFAAGNEANDSSDYPGAYHDIISVTSYAPDGLPTSYTNFGYGCNVSAPGGDWEIVTDIKREWNDGGCVLSTVPSTIPEYAGKNYGYMQGTSMACPHVSGVAALILSYAVEHGIYLTTERVYEILTSSVRNIDNELVGTKVCYTMDNLGRSYELNLSSYKGKMGTGKLDAVLAIMNLRGVICYPIAVDEPTTIEAGDVLGNGDLDVVMTNNYEIPEETRSALGIVDDSLWGNKLYLTCTKSGCAPITISYIAGGKQVGGGPVTGGMLVKKEILLVSRVVNDDKGWL